MRWQMEFRLGLMLGVRLHRLSLNGLRRVSRWVKAWQSYYCPLNPPALGDFERECDWLGSLQNWGQEAVLGTVSVSNLFNHPFYESASLPIASQIRQDSPV